VSETPLIHKILTLFSQFGGRLSRNNSGTLQNKRGTFVHFGVFSPGGSDLIGFLPVVITPEMVGTKVAVFTAIEIKIGRTATTPQQLNFIKTVKQNGGIAAIIHDSVTESELRDLTNLTA